MIPDAIWWTSWDYRSHERAEPGASWWFDNRVRPTYGGVVIQVIHQGRILVRDARGTHEVGPGQAFLFGWGDDSDYGRPPDQPDWVGHGEILVTSYVTYRGAGMHEHWQQLMKPWGRVVTLPSGADARLVHQGRHADARLVGELAAARATMAAVMAIAEVWAEAHRGRGSAVEQAMEELHRDPWRDQSLKALAQRCGCSREHLTRAFTAQYGMSPAAWQRQQRFERAMELLRTTDLSIAEIAERSGAGGFHRLARWTRAVHGLPPEQTRAFLRATEAALRR